MAGQPRSKAVRTDIAQPIRLTDYRPPDWLVETVSLDVMLHPSAARVRATLALKPNPKNAAAPLILDGDGLSLPDEKSKPAPTRFRTGWDTGGAAFRGRIDELLPFLA